MHKFGLYKRKLRGQTKCMKCSKLHNNAYLPVLCSCGEPMGGTKDITDNKSSGKTIINAKMINSELVSVRLNNRGTANRIFVNLSENKV